MTSRTNPGRFPGALVARERSRRARSADAPAEPGATDARCPISRPPTARGAQALRPRLRRNPNSISPACRRSNSITAVTDIRAFLAPGVPKELTRAALRRAWAADPAIRDFIGLAENDWDFTDPAAMPGFGALPEGTDIKKLVAQIFGEGEKPAEPRRLKPAAVVRRPEIADERRRQLASEPHAARPSTRADEYPISAKATSERDQSTVVHRDNNIATHNSIADDEAEEPKQPPPPWRRIASVESRTHSLRLLTRCLVGHYLYIEII